MLEQLLELSAQIDELESFKQLSTKRKGELAQIARAIDKQLQELQSAPSSADTDLCKDIMQCLRARLYVLSVQHKVALTLTTLSGFGEDQAANHVASYRADIRKMGVWGGLTELDFIARQLMGIRCHIYTIVQGKYRRVITIGDPSDPLADRHLLHTVNHYQVLTQAVTDGQKVDNGLVIATNPDGDCMYESILLVNHEPARGAFPGKGLVMMLRGAVASRISDQEIIAAIIGIVWQGEYGGLGPKMSEMVGSLQSGTGSGKLEELGSSSGKLELGGWVDYTKHFQTHFILTRTLQETTQDKRKIHVITNAGAATDWCDAFDKQVLATDGEVGALAWTWIRRKTVLHLIKEHYFTHLGLMWAEVETASGTWHVACAAANYYWSEVETTAPWIYHGSNIDKPSKRSIKPPARTSSKDQVWEATDMHSECFCLYYLGRWLVTNLETLKPSKITLHFFLEKPMCNRCQTVLELFTTGWMSHLTIDCRDDTINKY